MSAGTSESNGKGPCILTLSVVVMPRPETKSQAISISVTHTEYFNQESAKAAEVLLDQAFKLRGAEDKDRYFMSWKIDITAK